MTIVRCCDVSRIDMLCVLSICQIFRSTCLCLQPQRGPRYTQALHGVHLQEYQPDLFLCDFVMMGGGVLADKLGIPKAMMIIPAHLPPQTAFDYGSGSHLLATVPQWQGLQPRYMVCPYCCQFVGPTPAGPSVVSVVPC